MVLNKLQNASRQRDLLLAFGAFAVAFILWQFQGLFFLVYPLRLFVTMIHELGHGLAAILTGGRFDHFEVTQRGAGTAYTLGGWSFAIVQAGYLGTAIFGAALLIVANRVRRPGYVAAGLGIFIGILTALYSGVRLSHLSVIEMIIVGAVMVAAVYLFLTQETDQGRYIGVGVAVFGALLLVMFTGWGNTVLTITVGMMSALLLIFIGYRASRDVVLFTLNLLAFATGLNAITDAWVLFKIVSLPRSMMPMNDAAHMAHVAGGPAALWALLWIGLDILIFGSAVYVTLVKPLRRKGQEGQSLTSEK